MPSSHWSCSYLYCHVSESYYLAGQWHFWREILEQFCILSGKVSTFFGYFCVFVMLVMIFLLVFPVSCPSSTGNLMLCWQTIWLDISGVEKMLKKPQKPNPKFNNQINSQGWQKERKESEGLLRELSCCQQAEGRKINTGWRESKSLVKAKEKRRT